jgi:hydrogenase maturation protease
MTNRLSLLVLGLGNVLLGDDGAGAAAVARLRARYAWPESVRVFDGGTLGLALLPWVELADAVILVDAVKTDDPPGTLVRLDGTDVPPAVATRLSPHQIGVADLLDGARWRGRYPARIVLVGVVPESIDLAVGLSAPVAAALDGLITRVVEEARALGVDMRERSAAEIEGDRDASDLDRDGHRVCDVARLVGMPIGA